MKAITTDKYYIILEKCTTEAFESLRLKDIYPIDGIKRTWSVGTMEVISTNNNQTDEFNNTLKHKSYVFDEMETTFLIALEGYFKNFESKYSITRSYFYKKCYQALILNLSQNPKWHGRSNSFDIDKPDQYTFLSNMRFAIEGRTMEAVETTTQLENQSGPSQLSKKQIALKMIYEGQANVTRKTHGNSIYNHYTFWMKLTNRIANDGSNLQLQNKIDLFEKVIVFLDEKFKQKAMDEVKILKSYIIDN